MENVNTAQLKTYLCSQIARAACIFNIDEIIVFPETGVTIPETENKSDPNLFLTRVLQYLDTPQYMRRTLFPKHSDFTFVLYSYFLREKKTFLKQKITNQTLNKLSAHKTCHCFFF